MDIKFLAATFRTLFKATYMYTVRIKLNQNDSVFVKAAPGDGNHLLTQEERLLYTLTPTSPDVTMFFNLTPGDRFVIKTKRVKDRDGEGRGIVDNVATLFRTYEMSKYGEVIQVDNPTSEELKDFTWYGFESGIVQQANTAFLNTLIGEGNCVVEHRRTHPLSFRPSCNEIGGKTYPTKKSIYNSIVYEYFGVGNCKVLTADELDNLTDETAKGRIFIRVPFRVVYVTVYGELSQVKDLFENTLANIKVDAIEKGLVSPARVGAVATMEHVFGPKQDYGLTVIPVPQSCK